VQLALAAGTRDYRPAFIHVARARQRPTIGEPLMQEAIEHDFTSLDQRAAIPVVRADPVVREAVHQMGRWRAEFRATGAALKREDNFWIRKGWQPVLAVLAVRGEEGDLSWFRGRNLEVSLPTGSLCAERNAIGSALTQMPALDRERIEAIAVLGLPLEHEGNAPPEDPFIPGPNPLSPCGACREWLLKIAEVNPDFRVITFADEDLSHVHVDEVA
jgi:cytidine deaminase